MLKAEQLTKRFGDHLALDHLDLTIESGEVYCLLGSNGAGKSTTINIFLGFIPASSGRALIDDLEVSVNNHATRNLVAYIPEVVNLYPTLTGLENLAFFSGLAGFRYSRAEMAAFTDTAGLQPEALDKRVSSYSKGMRQKVGIAIALAKQARALFLDEPTSGLDPHASNEFAQIITRLSGQGVSTLMATHDLLMAKNLGHRIGIMHQGRLQQELRSDAVSYAELTDRYLSTVNQPV
ncbi:ABC transporter ATP-binding protein [Hymenobacter sp. ASUV-10]|uniref:ABC transporter ATP-binding protein n=1 Tax=Hymenobacter aranciens TaxID=3063996 RepID=A0ABT9B852_9BACT|nr:ABC transporter ATP-binding protein [Hymenobacter sp. ASUV-10]MDO7874440.1 ABC transporter ATP-binding protein [Hymenobacter sp. ASUV-10]